MALSSMIYSPFDRMRRYVGSVSWIPLVNLSRKIITYTLQSIENGHLKIIDVDGEQMGFGNPANGPCAELTVHKEAFWVRMMLFTDMVRPDMNITLDINVLTIRRVSQKVICLEKYLVQILHYSSRYLSPSYQSFFNMSSCSLSTASNSAMARH